MNRFTLLNNVVKVGRRSSPGNYDVRVRFADDDVIDAMVCRPYELTIPAEDWSVSLGLTETHVWANSGNYEIDPDLIVEILPPLERAA